MKKKIIFAILGFLFFLVLFSNTNYAIDLDEIENFTVTVDPRMNDASLDIHYEITWKVLNSIVEGPLTWVQIGTPNSSFTNPTALTDNIKRIQKYNSSFVRIDFKEEYKAGESVTFKYSIHQPNMYTVSGGKCEFEFTPAWFTDIRVDNLTLKWNADKVKKSNHKTQEENYLVWNKKNMKKGEKLTAKIQYEKKAFSSVKTIKKKNNMFSLFITVFVIVIFIGIILSALRGGGGYYRNSGFGPRYYPMGGCVRSCACACVRSCNCVSSCASSSGGSSCACACAGSGRAGCSRKDFYGTNLTTKKIQSAMKKE